MSGANHSSRKESNMTSYNNQSNEMEGMKRVNEEFKVWKKNVPFLYDLCLVHALEWPSLTVQWLPENDAAMNGQPSQMDDDSSDGIVRRLMLGTHTIDGENNCVLIAETRLPSEEISLESDAANAQNYGRMEIIQSINHPGEVNRARFMPDRSSIIATKSPSSEVLIFDRSGHWEKPSRNAPSKPELRLLGHTREGYGLAWSPCQPGMVLSGSEDTMLYTWDVSGSVHQSHGQTNGHEHDGATMSPLGAYTGHEGCVEDVCWHATNPSIFASCADDRNIIIWDARQKGHPSLIAKGLHQAEINCVVFNPHNPFSLLSGSADRTLALLDLRNIDKKLHSFEHHSDQIFSCVWNPYEDSVFASGSGDRQVAVWDINKIGQEQSAEDAEDGPPELLFVHAGHTEKVSDLAWLDNMNKNGGDSMNQWVIASTADDNIVQVWAMADSIYGDDEDIRTNDNE